MTKLPTPLGACSLERLLVTERRESHLVGSSDLDLSVHFISVLHSEDPRARHFVEVTVACPLSSDDSDDDDERRIRDVIKDGDEKMM